MPTATHLHAMLVHFPIALLLVGFAAEIAGFITKKEFFHQVGFGLLLLGAAGAVLAYFTGDAAGEGLEEGVLAQAVGLHEAAAARTLWAVLLAMAVRLAMEATETRQFWARSGALVLYLIAVCATAQTAYLGGQLVFVHGAGVELKKDQLQETK